MTDFIVRIVAAFGACIGFSIFFNMKKERLLHAAILGTLSGAIYIYCDHLFPESVFLNNMIPALICTLLSELSARWKKAPAIVFILPSIIILIPGSSFYYTMSFLVSGEHEKFQEWGGRTLLSAFGISVGILIATFAFYEVLHRISERNKQTMKS